VILAGLALGALLGLVAVPIVRRLPRGIPERLEQPAWTQACGHPIALVGAGASIGALLGALAPQPHLLAGLVGGVAALLLALAARGGFGLGDVKLIAMSGLVLGAALPLAVVLGLVAACLVALPALMLRGRGATLPLVPFLALGALLACTAPARIAVGL
jgi:prepilin signal peptidase PulO-like enzyme (type II secretory pathway)